MNIKNLNVRRVGKVQCALALAAAFLCSAVLPSALAQQTIDESANCKPEAAPNLKAELASLEKFFLAEREANERRMEALIPILENSDEPLAWLWAATLQQNKLANADMESKTDAASLAPNQRGEQARKSTIQSRDLLYKRALDAAPRSPAVLMTLVRNCRFEPSAFCDAHPDLLDRWQAVDPDNGLLYHEKAFRQPLAVQVEMLARLLAASKITSHAEEVLSVAKKVDAGMPESQRDQLLNVLLPLATLPPIPLVSGPEVCNTAFRAAAGPGQPGDADPGNSVKQQCLDVLRRVAQESDNPMWEQFAVFRLQMVLPEGPERDQYKKQFEQAVVKLRPLTEVDIAVAKGRLSRAEANKISRQYMTDVIGIGYAAARNRQIEASKALLATLEAAAGK